MAASTATDGSFSFGALVPGDYTVSLGSTCLEFVSGSRITVPADASAPVVTKIVVRRLPRLQVTVTDVKGRAVPRAIVRTKWQGEAGQELGPLLHTDGQGEAAFDASVHKDAQSLEVWAWAPGLAPTSASAPATGTGHIQIALLEGASRWLRVRDAATRQAVQAFTVVHGPRILVFPPKPVEAVLDVRDHDGRCRLHGIRGDHHILVRAEGYQAMEVDLHEDPADEDVVIELHQAAALEIVVLGLPDSARGTLQVVRIVGKDGSALSPTASVLAAGELVGGRARIRGIPAGTCWLRPAGAWCAPFAHGPLTLQSGEKRQLSLQVAAGCSISCRLVPPEAQSLITGAKLMRVDGTMYLPLAGTASFPLDADGRLRCTGVSSGDWHVEVIYAVESWTGVSPLGRPRPLQVRTRLATLTVPDAPEFECELDCSGLLSARVRGLVNTAALSDRMTLRPIGSRGGTRWLGQAIVIGEGGAFVASLPPGDYRWMLQRGEGTDTGRAALLGETTEVRAGAEMTMTLAMPVLEKIELLLAPELQRTLRGSVSIRYQAATEIVAGQYAIAPDGTVRIEIASGEPFLAQVAPYGMLALERLAGGPPARYVARRP